MKSKWLIIAVLFPVISLSQESSSRSRLNTIASVGMAAGESTAKPLYQLSAGLAYDRYFTGVGVGIDQYNFNSVPLFADWRMNFGKAGQVFLYTNCGYNFTYNNDSRASSFFKTTDRFYGGFYMDAGIGYRVRLNSLHRLLLSAGYSQKNVNNKVGYTFPCINPPCLEDIYTYHYTLGRIVTKLSWEFGNKEK